MNVCSCGSKSHRETSTAKDSIVWYIASAKTFTFKNVPGFLLLCSSSVHCYHSEGI